MDARRSTDPRRYTCPRCGLPVYKTKATAHEAACAEIVARFGSPEKLAKLFWEDVTLCLEDIGDQLPVEYGGLVRRMVIIGGVPAHELRAREEDRADEAQGATHPRARRRHRCRRCGILLDAPAVPDGRDSAERLCGWCDGSVPPVSPAPARGAEPGRRTRANRIPQ